ncbi:MAG: hypothetical protein ACRENN_03715 [Candidatus Eiseniibacteriota bacterium]
MKIQRLPIVMFGLFLAVLVTTFVAHAQTPIPKAPVAQVQFSGTPMHVKGTVEVGTCGAGLVGAVLKVTEYWYAVPSVSSKDLVISGTTADKLMFNGSQLVQGRELGSATVAAAGAFDVTWSEVATAGRKPWATVVNQRTGATVTAYRLLRLEVTTGPNSVGSIKTPPVIQFFGTETTKDVGVVTVNCTIFG